MNLSFVWKICDSGYNVCFSPSKCFVHDHTSQKVIEIDYREDKLYVLNQFKKSIVTTSNMDLSLFHLFFSYSPFYLLHSGLGHVSTFRLKFLAYTSWIR